MTGAPSGASIRLLRHLTMSWLTAPVSPWSAEAMLPLLRCQRCAACFRESFKSIARLETLTRLNVVFSAALVLGMGSTVVIKAFFSIVLKLLQLRLAKHFGMSLELGKQRGNVKVFGCQKLKTSLLASCSVSQERNEKLSLLHG